MSVFNAILKSTKASMVTIIIYFSVFVIFGSLSARTSATTKDTMFVDSTVTVAVTDNDDSAISRGLVSYLERTQNVVGAQTDSYMEMNDNVRFDVYDYALIIPEGFADRVKNGEREDLLEYIAPGATAPQYLLSGKIDTYVQDLMVYLECGYSEEEALELTGENMDQLAETKAFVMDASDENYRSFYSGIFTFNGYTLLMILCVCLSTVLIFTKDRDVKNRINVSGMHFKTKNFATIMAVMSVGFAITTAVNIVVILMGLSDHSGKILFYCLNAYMLMLVGVGMAFLFSAITTSEQLINMLSNMLVLSMSFICGVFINMDFLSAGIVKAAHFFPLYWYTMAVRLINDTPVEEIFGKAFGEYLLIEALFACAMFAAGLIISKKKEQYAL